LTIAMMALLVAADVLLTVLVSACYSALQSSTVHLDSDWALDLVNAVVVCYLLSVLLSIVILIQAGAHCKREYARPHALRQVMLVDLIAKTVLYLHLIYDMVILALIFGPILIVLLAMPFLLPFFIFMMFIPPMGFITPVLASLGMATLLAAFCVLIAILVVVNVMVMLATSLPLVKFFAHIKYPRYKTPAKVCFCILEFVPFADLICGFCAGLWLYGMTDRPERQSSAEWT
jgi:hypothetical protein